MSKSYTHTPPRWQSKALMAGALVALAAVEISAAAYAFQSASRSQVLELGGWAIPTDVALKTAQSIAAGLALALGPAVAWHLWRAGRSKAHRRQACLAIAAALVGFTVSASNLSGYFAWTRDQRAVEVATANPLYSVAAANAQAVVEGRAAFLTGADRRLLAQGQALTTAQRTLGDVLRAAFILMLVSGMATAYRLPGQAKRRRRRGRQGRSERHRSDNVEALDTARARRA